MSPTGPTAESIARLTSKLRLATPLLAVYDAVPSDRFAPLVYAERTECCFAYYPRWLGGETLVIEKGGGGCPGGHRALGLEKSYPPYMAHFLTDGVGAPKGEGLKVSADIAQVFLDRALAPDVRSGSVLIGPLRPDQWDAVRSVTFLADPDRLAGVMTLAGYWTADANVAAPFNSGCGLLWRALGGLGHDTAILGATDIAMRKYVPPDILTLTVGPEHFLKMLTFPEDSFLHRTWWNDLMEARARRLA